MWSVGLFSAEVSCLDARAVYYQAAWCQLYYLVTNDYVPLELRRRFAVLGLFRIHKFALLLMSPALLTYHTVTRRSKVRRKQHTIKDLPPSRNLGKKTVHVSSPDVSTPPISLCQACDFSVLLACSSDIAHRSSDIHSTPRSSVSNQSLPPPRVSSPVSLHCLSRRLTQACVFPTMEYNTPENAEKHSSLDIDACLVGLGIRLKYQIRATSSFPQQDTRYEAG